MPRKKLTPAEKAAKDAEKERERLLRHKIIDEMERYPIIFNKAHPEHFKREKVLESFEEIGEIVGVSGSVVETKWRSLVDAFKWRDKSGSAGTTIQEKTEKWEFFRKMHNFKVYLIPRSTVTNRQRRDSGDENEENVAPAEDAGAGAGGDAEGNGSGDGEDGETNVTRPVHIPKRAIPTVTPSTTFAKVPTPSYKVTSRAQQATQMANDVITNLLHKDEDEIDLAFDSLAKRIKKHLSPIEQEDCLDEVQEVVARFLRNARHKRQMPASEAGVVPDIQAAPQMQLPPIPYQGEMTQLLNGPGIVQVDANRQFYSM